MAQSQQFPDCVEGNLFVVGARLDTLDTPRQSRVQLVRVEARQRDQRTRTARGQAETVTPALDEQRGAHSKGEGQSVRPEPEGLTRIPRDVLRVLWGRRRQGAFGHAGSSTGPEPE